MLRSPLLHRGVGGVEGVGRGAEEGFKITTVTVGNRNGKLGKLSQTKKKSVCLLVTSSVCYIHLLFHVTNRVKLERHIL